MPDPPPHPRPWTRVATRHGEDMRLFRPRWDVMRNPRTGAELDRLVLETPDWVNVVALAAAGDLVCVVQYRFGTDAVELEIPSGIVDAGESHEEAARRELLEETGYAAARWTYLGAVAPNAAYQDNVCHHWLAEDAVLTAGQALDEGEDIAVELVPLAEVPRLVAEGRLWHALVVSALARVVDLRDARPRGVPAG